jgi:hypothetical protein
MKANKATTRARVDDVLRVLNDGATCWQIRQYVAEREATREAPWTIPEGGRPLSERQIRRYIALADKVIAEENRTHRRRLIRRHVAKLQSLFARCVNKGDERTARAVLHDLAEVQGLLGDELARQVEDLQRRIDKLLGRGNGDGDPSGNGAAAGPDGGPARGGAAGESPPDPAEGGPGELARPGEPAPGPVASPHFTVGIDEDVAPLFPPVG